MLREFFLHKSFYTRAWAWFGLLVIGLHGCLKAYLKFKFNEFYGDFYDAGGRAVEVGSGDWDALKEGRVEIMSLLVKFAFLCVPDVFLHPLYKFTINNWILSWRKALINSYISDWKTAGPKIENGAQRVHEDTQRFARGVQTLCVALLDSVLTLIVFYPLLLFLGEEVNPFLLPDCWLALLCTLLACVGVGGSFLFGSSLVSLEVENQKVEADLRRKLVLLEEDPLSILNPSMRDKDGALDMNTVVSEEVQTQRKKALPLFRNVICDLVQNYRRLYRAFAIFSLWLGSYEQTVVILPYLITAPMLYSETYNRRITLGLVTQVSNAFSQVFASLNVLSSNWIEVTDWLSVLRRLRQWESHLHTPATTCTCALMPVHEVTSSDTHVEMKSIK